MDWAYQYRDPEKLYLNVTNRCTNRCSFCVRSQTSRLGDGQLLGGEEPGIHELLDTIDAKGGADRFSEIVWCGYGEPTFRLDLILDASPIFHAAGAKVRLNTNGHGCLIHGRDILPDLAEVIDRVNVSLNAPTQDRYLDLCRPDPARVTIEPAPEPADFWQATLDFLIRSPDHINEVQASVVGHTLGDDEIELCLSLAVERTGAAFRVR